MNNYIENVHKQNFKLINKYNIKIGDKFIHKYSKEITIIDFIHPLYGWVISKPYAIKQDLSNIDDFYKFIF